MYAARTDGSIAGVGAARLARVVMEPGCGVVLPSRGPRPYCGRGVALLEAHSARAAPSRTQHYSPTDHVATLVTIPTAVIAQN